MRKWSRQVEAASGTLVPAIFLHIQKTAGTSLVEIVSPHYGQSMMSHGDHVGKPYTEFIDVPFVSGHFGFDFASCLMSGRYSFTFLRNPARRILSMYSFCRHQDPNVAPMYKIAQERPLEEFLHLGFESPLVKSRIWNNQVWQLAHGWASRDRRSIDSFDKSELFDLAMLHLEQMSHVGFTETFDADRDVILRGLGIARPVERTVANTASKEDSQFELSDVSLDLLDQLTVLDRRLYEETWRNRTVSEKTPAGHNVD